MRHLPVTGVYSHQRWRLGRGRTCRWQVGFRAPRDAEGDLLLTRTAVQALCAAHRQLRAQAVADRLTDGETYYETALIGVDAEYERIHLDGEHLVLDWRHVAGDSDAMITVDPDDAGLYRVPAPQGAWVRTRPGTCDLTIEPSGPPQVAVVHQRSGESCTVTVFVEGQPLPRHDVYVFDIDPGRGYPVDDDGMPLFYTDEIAAAASLGPAVRGAVHDAYAAADWQHWAVDGLTSD